jgi:hypothetical protein
VSRMGTKQVTISGDDADELPTQYWCDRCDKPHLVAEVSEHGHAAHLYESREVAEETNLEPLIERGDDEDNGLDDEPEEVGEMFRITLSYTVDYSFRIPAGTKHQAKRRAKDLRPAINGASSAMHVHTDVDSLTEIFEDHDKLPDGYMAGDAPLWEVYDEGDDTDDE